MKFSDMKKAAHNWLADQKLWMSTMVNPESINRDGDIAEGFIDALRLLGIYSANQAKVAYKELRAARDAAIKEAALGVDSTEDGKGDHPKMNDSLAHTYSITILISGVKRGGASE